MNLMDWLFVVVLILGIWPLGSSVQPFWGEAVIEEFDSVAGEHGAHHQIFQHILFCVVWAEGIKLCSRWRQPYCDFMKCLHRKICRLAKERRHAFPCTQRKRECMAKPEETAFVSMEESPIVMVMTEEQMLDRTNRGQPPTILTNHLFCPNKGCQG